MEYFWGGGRKNKGEKECCELLICGYDMGKFFCIVLYKNVLFVSFL